LIARIPQDNGGLARYGCRQQLVDGVDLLEDEVAADMRADLRPQRVVAGDEEHRELGAFGCGNGLTPSGVRRGGLTFLVAFCTDTLRESRFAALQFRSTRDAERSRGHACKSSRK